MTVPTFSSISAVPPERDAWRAMFALAIGFFVSLLDQSMIAVAIPGIQHGLGASVNSVMWVSAIYLLAVVVPLLFTGRLGDIFTQKRVFQVGISLFGLGALGCALAPNIGVLIAARGVQGLGASLQMPQSMAVINRVFARERRGHALGMWGIIGSVASLAGPLVGGFVVGTFGWQAVFWVHVPFVILAVVLAQLWVPVLPTSARSIDVASVAVSFVALAAIVFGIQQGPELGWPAWMWALLAAGVAAAVLFVRLQARAAKRGTEALVPLSLFKDRNYSAGSGAIVAMGFMAASMMLPIMLWLQDVKGMGAGQAGMVVAPMAVISLLVSPAAGALADRVDPRRLATTGFLVLIATFVVSWLVMHLDLNPWWLCVPMVAQGIGQSLIWGSNAATSMRDIPPAQMGAASGVYNMSRQVGSVVGVAAVSAVMQSADADVALANSLGVIVAMLVVGMVASLFFRDTLHTATGAAEPAQSGQRG
ncbi:DHA2 family efflux MFS transporter permease subunit [uncultured Corynebacterium sp.]|uniref:DHA2 family efflux MFS transporter permease subunit n=1 Tax=uncultured Corynebacterium sp. TaxID=159447 RepID=UPI0025EEA682|nr:DHA2 family efflux MFS transporter permease subunit [uncultured Corynebacterium sp.]